MHPGARVVMALGLWGLVGCATTYRGVASVVAEVKRDEVAAAVNMKNDNVGLEGRVKHKGLQSEKEAVAKSSLFPAPLGFGTAEIEIKDKNVGFIELESSTAQAGQALCLFEPWAFEKLATVREGQPVRVVCQFFKVEGEPGNRVPVFHNCSVSD